MGMFDYVRVEFEVPDMSASTLQNLLWQTKDLANQLDHYIVTKEGELTLYGEKQPFTGVIGMMAMTGSPLNGDLQFFDLFIQFEHGDFVRISNQPIRSEEGVTQ